MEFRDAVKICLTKKYCSFKGRASRSEFWWFCLFTLLINIAVAIVGAIAPALASIISAVQALWLLLPTVSVSTRRLHDRDLSGWWQMLPLAAALPAIAGAVLEADGLLVLAGSAAALASLGLLVVPPDPTVLALIHLTTAGSEGHHIKVVPPFGDNRRKSAPLAHCRPSCQTFGYSVWPGHHLPY